MKRMVNPDDQGRTGTGMLGLYVTVSELLARLMTTSSPDTGRRPSDQSIDVFESTLPSTSRYPSKVGVAAPAARARREQHLSIGRAASDAGAAND